MSRRRDLPVALQRSQRRARHPGQRVAQTAVISLLRSEPVALSQLVDLDDRFH